jgi:putative phosphoesterase
MNPTWQTKTLKLPCPCVCGVISDTHASSLEPVFQEALRRHFQGITQVIHLGDVTCPAVISDLETLGFSVIPVKGNNNRLLNTPHVVVLESGPWRIGATHGGGGGYLEVSRRSLRQVQSFCNAPLHAVLHGHSHIPMLTEIDGILFFNPGSLGHPRSYPGMLTPEVPSIGILEITPEALHFKHIFLDG